jgi:hypothetical protein
VLRSLVVVTLLALTALTAPHRVLSDGPDGAVHEDGHAHVHSDPVAMDPVKMTKYDVDAHAAWHPSEYDGLAYAADAADLTTLPTVHAIYLHGSDAPNRFGQFAAMFQADARQASARFTTLFGSGIRFDERAVPSGRPLLDITVVRSLNTQRKLSERQQFSLIANELRSRNIASNPNKKYLVWADVKSSYCGQSELAQDTARNAANRNELSTISVIYRAWDAKLATGGFCRGRSAAHELGHALGALQRVAPNAYDGAHCNDSPEDVMCNIVRGAADTGDATVDWRRDDYWDPAADPAAGSDRRLSWWTINLSRFICPTSGCSQPNSPRY